MNSVLSHDLGMIEILKFPYCPTLCLSVPLGHQGHELSTTPGIYCQLCKLSNTDSMLQLMMICVLIQDEQAHTITLTHSSSKKELSETFKVENPEDFNM